jgi:hypothetical protein
MDAEAHLLETDLLVHEQLIYLKLGGYRSNFIISFYYRSTLHQMELKADENVIEIRPQSKFIVDLLISEFKQSGAIHLHPSIMEKVIGLSADYSDILKHILPIQFLGGNDKKLHYTGEVKDLYQHLCGLIVKHSTHIPFLNSNTMDDILFITLFSWGKAGEPVSKDENEIYLDELIELYLRLKRAKINFSTVQNGVNFDRLSENEKEALINNDEVKVEARMLGGINVNRLIYIPSEYPIAIKGEGKGSRDIILPQRLTSNLYSSIMDEIVQQHKRYKTKFYRMLCEDDFDSIRLEERTKARRIKSNVRLLYSLATHLNDYLDFPKPTLVATHKYRLIYSVLNALEFITSKSSEPEKYIRKLLHDNKPINYLNKQGEKQFYRS